MSNLKIKVKDGVRLRNPLGGAVMNDSIVYTVPNNKFWRRRIKAGDVIDTSKPEILLSEKKNSIENEKPFYNADKKSQDNIEPVKAEIALPSFIEKSKEVTPTPREHAKKIGGK